jgi:hypothetical protein
MHNGPIYLLNIICPQRMRNIVASPTYRYIRMYVLCSLLSMLERHLQRSRYLAIGALVSNATILFYQANFEMIADGLIKVVLRVHVADSNLRVMFLTCDQSASMSFPSKEVESITVDRMREEMPDAL